MKALRHPMLMLGAVLAIGLAACGSGSEFEPTGPVQDMPGMGDQDG